MRQFDPEPRKWLNEREKQDSIRAAHMYANGASRAAVADYFDVDGKKAGEMINWGVFVRTVARVDLDGHRVFDGPAPTQEEILRQVKEDFPVLQKEGA